MTLVVDLFDPASGPYSYLNAIEHDAAGFESYRKGLWGSQSLVLCARFFPILDGDDLFVFPDDLDAFADECRMVSNSASEIADELWSETARAAHIINYMDRFLAAVDLARLRGVGVCIS